MSHTTADKSSLHSKNLGLRWVEDRFTVYWHHRTWENSRVWSNCAWHWAGANILTVEAFKLSFLGIRKDQTILLDSLHQFCENQTLFTRNVGVPQCGSWFTKRIVFSNRCRSNSAGCKSLTQKRWPQLPQGRQQEKSSYCDGKWILCQQQNVVS